MLRSLWFILKLAVVVIIAVALANAGGRISIALPDHVDLWVASYSWPAYKIDTSIGMVVLAAVIFGAVIALLYRFWGALVRSPRQLGKAVDEGRHRRGYKALTQGMVAVAAGDASEAQRFARKADQLLNDPPLTMLLSAQAAQLGGDEQAAQRYFEAMLERQETRFLGLRGLVMQKLRAGDEEAALEYARQAYSLRPESAWLLETLFDLSEKVGRLEDAEKTLREAARAKLVPAAEASRKRAVILVERAQQARSNGRRETAIKLTREAHKLVPELVPATEILADSLLQGGQAKEAAKVLERSWPLNPHPSLAALYKRARPGTNGIEALQNMRRLVGGRASHNESRLALAEAALGAQLWGEARRYLNDAAKDGAGTVPSERICRLMARLEEAEHGDAERAREWLMKIPEAPQDASWICKSCGAEADDWSARCGACGAFDSLRWTTPTRVATPALATVVPEAALEPPAPKPTPPAGDGTGEAPPPPAATPAPQQPPPAKTERAGVPAETA